MEQRKSYFFLFITAAAATTATTISTSSDNRELTTSYSLFWWLGPLPSMENHSGYAAQIDFPITSIHWSQFCLLELGWLMRISFLHNSHSNSWWQLSYPSRFFYTGRTLQVSPILHLWLPPFSSSLFPVNNDSSQLQARRCAEPFNCIM